MGKRLAAFSQFSDEPEAPISKPKSTNKKHSAKQFELFNTPASEVDTTVFQLGRQVPNELPTAKADYRLAIVGEAPGEDEERIGKPFIGQSGRFLDQVLAKNGIARVACFVGNVCQFRPPKNDIKAFDLNGPEITEGLAQLRKDLAAVRPNLVLLLGKTALWAAKGSKDIGNWRGSLFLSDRLIDPGTDFIPPSVKCIATYHPAACLRQYDWTPLVMLDVRKAVAEARYPDLRLPQRDLLINLPLPQLLAELDFIIQNKLVVSPDIEGGVFSMSCISFAISPTKSILVPFAHLDGGNYWDNIEDELEVWKRVIRILCDPAIPKVFQNGLYDRFVLQYAYNILTRNSQDDTMLKFWEAYCELEKNLGFQCSILTQEPYYKFERKVEDQDTFYKYCCKDSCVTYEINDKLTKLIDTEQQAHYAMNNALLYPLLYMELRGISYNEPLAAERLVEVQSHIYRAQEALDIQACADGAIQGIDFNQPKAQILAHVQSVCCYVRDQSQPKKKFIEAGYWDVFNLLQSDAPLTVEQRGQISILCEATMNIKSIKFKDYLYNTCKLPVQYKKDPETKELRPTTDYGALLKLSKSSTHPVLKLALELSRLRTRAQMLDMQAINGRVHCSYNLVGSETGRVSSSKSNLYVHGSKVGANMQTIPDDWDLEDSENPLTQGMRDLLVADPGCYLGKCDLKGADGWTVGSYMAMLGDPTMLDDLKFGLKPAQVVAYILKHGAGPTLGKTRNELKEMCREIKKEDWEYFVSKQGIWGTCYTMGPRKLAERVFIESEGKVNLSEKEAKDFQACIKVRYRVQLWHSWMQRFLETQSYPAKLKASNGFTRKFFGRKTEILGEALAHLPQVYTTYATNCAAYRLWTDPDNRIKPTGETIQLRVEPMHQVHDELLVQFKIADTPWAISKLKQWFDNPIVIANQKLVIPFDGAYGTTWAMDEKSKVGEIK